MIWASYLHALKVKYFAVFLGFLPLIMILFMMGGDSSSDESHKSRVALGDVTNQVGKRGISAIIDNPILKSGDGYGGSVENKEGLQIAKEACLVAENLETKKCITKRFTIEKEKGKRACVPPHSCSEVNSLRGQVIAGISKVPSEAKEPNLPDSSFSQVRSTAVSQCGVDISVALRESCVSSMLMPISSCDKDSLSIVGTCNNDEGKPSSESTESNPLHENVATHADRDDDNELEVDNLASFDCSRLPESQESRSVEPERCTGFKGDCYFNTHEGLDSIKSCSCSFCTKAAYIWLDLHYQDIKGRIAALKKSQKDKNSLRKQGIEKHGHGNSNNLSKLESDLMGHWRCLFLHMEDIFVGESSQLEASLLTLKDLREKYKTELGLINGMPSGTL